jgi:hypothetical protein
MKKLLMTTAAFAALITPSYAQPIPVDGNTWLSACTSQRTSPSYSLCVGYVRGFADGLIIRENWPPSNVTTTQLVDVSVRYLRNHPEMRHTAVNALLLKAFNEAWPREARDAVPPTAPSPGPTVPDAAPPNAPITLPPPVTPPAPPRKKDSVERCLADGILYPERAKLAFEMDENLLRITYSLDPWALTRNSAINVVQFQIANIVPCVLSASSDIDAVQFEVFGTFKNIKGQESYQSAIFAKISRATASEIMWKKIRSKDVPKLVDVYREHPGTGSQPPTPNAKIDPTNEDDKRLPTGLSNYN